MAQAFGTALFLLAATAGLLHGMSAFVRLATAAAELPVAWQDEYVLRRCATLAATKANFETSATLVADLLPAWRERAKHQAQLLATAIVSHYPGHEGEPCIGGPSLQVDAEVHLQRHPGQPVFWPNWLMRFVPND